MKNAHTVLFLNQIEVVLAVVIFFVGDAVQSLLAKRQQSILSNLQQAQQRAEESDRLFRDAQEKFTKASSQVEDINLQTNQSIEQQKKQYQTQILADLQRLQEFQKSTIDSQQQKIQKQISQTVILSSIQKVDQKFQKGFDQKTQKSVNTFSIHLLQNVDLLGGF